LGVFFLLWPLVLFFLLGCVYFGSEWRLPPTTTTTTTLAIIVVLLFFFFFFFCWVLVLGPFLFDLFFCCSSLYWPSNNPYSCT
jgi:hypothetical protein